MLSDAPPSRDDATTSFTCPELVDVKTLTQLGNDRPGQRAAGDDRRQLPPQRAVADVVNQQIRDGVCHATEMSDVSQTSEVSGASKSMWSASAYFAVRHGLIDRVGQRRW